MLRFFHIKTDHSTVERQRNYILIYVSLGYLVGIVLNVFDFTTPKSLFFLAINAVHFVSILSVFAAFLAGKIRVYNALVILMLVTHAEISVEMIHQAYHGGIPGGSVILGNMVLLAFLLMLSIMSYIRGLPFILSVMTILTYGFCVYEAPEAFPFSFLLLFVMAFGLISAMGTRMMKGVEGIQRENVDFRQERQSLLELFHMDKDQLSDFIRLAKEKQLSVGQAEDLLGLLSKDTQRRITEGVARMMRQQEIDHRELGKKIPNLTPGEREVCCLILEGHSLAEIVARTGKSESNVTSTRSRIRKKLGLSHQDNLHDALRKIARPENSR